MRAFLQRILIASQWGASLVLAAGCSSSVETELGGTGGSTGTGTTTQDAGTVLPNLPPMPTPACSGPIYDAGGGYDGQCCEIKVCYTPSGACLAPDDARPMLSGLPPGSGTCECSDLHGPYASSSDPNQCCYLVGSISCEGRPLIVHGAARLAGLIPGPSAWSKAPPDRDALRRDFAAALNDIDGVSLPAEVREHVARRWADRARNEHASVASFGRFAIALMALGAPPELVEAAHRAAIDEVDHARLCLAMASRYAGEPMGFGALRVDGAFADVDSLEAAAVDTVMEGCVGETLAALEAAATAALAGPPAVRLALEIIAEDEARHAELGWAFVRWALGTGNARLAARVSGAFEAAMRKAMNGAEPREQEPPAAHGFLPTADLVALRRQAVIEVIRPAAAALVGASANTDVTATAMA
ncbi:putative lipoprotein [Minicystis rosea]|nr:putative lipoprotein [Minicystis rosea]